MALKDDLIQVGIHPEAAQFIATDTIDSAPTKSVSSAVTAAGTTVADATALTSFINAVTTVAASTGVKLPSACPVGQWVLIQNTGANICKVYPHSASGTINNGSAGVGVDVAVGGAANLCFRRSATAWDVYVLARET